MPTFELAKVSKLLIAVDGENYHLSAGKTLDQMTLEEIPDTVESECDDLEDDNCYDITDADIETDVMQKSPPSDNISQNMQVNLQSTDSHFSDASSHKLAVINSAMTRQKDTRI